MLPLPVTEILEEIDADIPAKPASYGIAEADRLVSGWRDRETITGYSRFLIRYIYGKGWSRK